MCGSVVPPSSLGACVESWVLGAEPFGVVDGWEGTRSHPPPHAIIPSLPTSSPRPYKTPTPPPQSFENTRTELGQALGIDAAAKKETPPAFYIESNVGGYCGLCQVPSVNGTGMSSCEVQDDCRALNLPKGSQRYAAQ